MPAIDAETIAMTSRRDFFKFAGIAGGAVAAGAVSRVAMAALPEPVIQASPNTMAPLVPDSGRPYNPVVTLNGWTLPWRMNQGVKEFHLVAEPVVREMAPGMKAHLWGYNGMLISAFELLADARDQVGAVTAALDAQQQFWLADAALQASVIGRPTSTTLSVTTSAPSDAGAGH